MIEKTTLREYYLDRLDFLIKEVKESRRKTDEACNMEIVTLMNQIRESTYDLFEAINTWQQGFTRTRRPEILRGDYMVKIVSSTNFVNGTHLRRIMNFSIERGNILLLPRPNKSTQPVMPVSKEFAAEIHKFAAPQQDRIVKVYQAMLNCVPQAVFAQLVPISEWMGNPWIPKLFIVSSERVAALAENDTGPVKSKMELRREAVMLKRETVKKRQTKVLGKSGRQKLVPLVDVTNAPVAPSVTAANVMVKTNVEIVSAVTTMPPVNVKNNARTKSPALTRGKTGKVSNKGKSLNDAHFASEDKNTPPASSTLLNSPPHAPPTSEITSPLKAPIVTTAPSGLMSVTIVGSDGNGSGISTAGIRDWYSMKHPDEEEEEEEDW